MYDMQSMHVVPHVGVDSDRMMHCMGEDSDRCMIYDRMHVVHPCIIMTHAIASCVKSSFLQAHVGKTCIIINKTIHQWMIDV